MRMTVRIGSVMALSAGIGWIALPTAGDAAERRLEQLPGDLATVLLLWTEPLKQIAIHSRQMDPVTGLWLGLIDGSVQSLSRSAKLFLSDGARSPTSNEPGKMLQYTF